LHSIEQCTQSCPADPGRPLKPIQTKTRGAVKANAQSTQPLPYR
jgi:hypothetical protein